MKKKEWNEGLSHLDPELVERYVLQKDRLRRRGNTKEAWLRFGAIAACFALLASVLAVVPALRDDGFGADSGSADSYDTSVYDPQKHEPIAFDPTASSEKVYGNNIEFVVGTSTALNAVADPSPPAFEFSRGIAVKARVVKNHPDRYYKLDISSDHRPVAYRLIGMETIEVISGEGVPDCFLYLIPEYVYVDMSVYDSLLISMSQLGAENYVLKNATQGQMESFGLPVFADEQDRPELGNVIAFTDGVFDESLWQNENWLYGYQFARYYLENPQLNYLVVARGDSESVVISAINKRYDEWYTSYRAISVITLDFASQAAKDAIEYVKPFKNGVFSQKYEPYYGNGELIFRRFINGCQTEETITIDLLTEEVSCSEVRYTDKDLAQMEDLSAHLSEKAAEYAEQLPTPPHTDPEGKELLCLNLYAWYSKADGKLFGVIKTAWKYKETDNYYVQYYDDAYVLDISRDDLVSVIGTRNVYTGEYGTGTEMPM